MSPNDPKEKFFADLNVAYEKLKAKPDEWQAELEERQRWGSTLLDGMEDAV